MRSPILLLTRPRADSERFLEALAAEGIRPGETIISPLIEIAFTGNLPRMIGYRGLVFTSVNGVRAYQNAGGPHRETCFTVGAGTADAARASGLHPVSAEGDVEALLALVAARSPEGPLLHIRGTHSRGNLANRLSGAGIETHEAILYDQAVQPLSVEAQAALGGDSPVVAPIFSPRTAAALASYGPVAAPLYLCAMSAAVAEPLAPLAARRIAVAAQPSGTAMRRAVVEVWSRAQSLEGRQVGQ